MNQQKRPLSPRMVILMLFFILVIPMLPLLVSWRWTWWEGWVYALIYVLSFVLSRVLAAKRHPDLLAERGRMLQHPDVKSWDKYLSPIVGLGGGLIPLVAGLDARLGWSPTFSLPLKLFSSVVILGGFAFGSWALIENRFFSGVVRIQHDRGHRVISSGPYRWLRHPGYAGALLAYLATPLFLDAAWAYLPVALVAVVLIVRTALEDRTLQEELPGYREYATRVRYRLLPGVW